MYGALTEWSIVQVCKTSVRGFESHGHLIKNTLLSREQFSVLYKLIKVCILKCRVFMIDIRYFLLCGGIKIMKSIFSSKKYNLLKIKYKKGLKSDKIQDHFFLLDQNKVDKRQNSDFFLFVK